MSDGFQKDLIYDIGMHQGEDSELYLKKGFRVIGIEAVPALAKAAGESLREYVESGQLVILNVAIAEREGALTFFESTASSVWGTLYPEWARRNEAKSGKPCIERSVEGTRLATILSKYGIPYYLKIDVEGADTLCLEALKAFEQKPKFVSFESTMTSWRDLEHEFALLKELGYSKYKVVAQHKVHKQRSPAAAKEGRYVDHRFQPGASGLFGDEAPGKWLSEEDALKRYRRAFFWYKLFGNQGYLALPWLVKGILHRLGLTYDAGWYDTHAGVAQAAEAVAGSYSPGMEARS